MELRLLAILSVAGFCTTFFEQRNSVVNDEVANVALAIPGTNTIWWIGIHTLPDPAPRHFQYVSGGPFTSLSYRCLAVDHQIFLVLNQLFFQLIYIQF